MNEFVEWIKQITIFLVLARMVIHLRPKAEYEKYLKLIVGIMVLAMILEQGISIVFGGGKSLWEEREILWERILSENF